MYYTLFFASSRLCERELSRTNMMGQKERNMDAVVRGQGFFLFNVDFIIELNISSF